MKKIVALALILMLALPFAAMAETGAAQGFGGVVTVTLTVEDGKIVDAAIVGDGETPEVGGAALETLKAQLVEAGSAEIDGVSGASVTSGAVRLAAALALGAQADAVSAEAQGFGGAVTVTLSVADGKIVGAAIVGDGETPEVGGAALATLAGQLVAAGSAEIDGVSGASITSGAVKEAAAAAMGN